MLAFAAGRMMDIEIEAKTGALSGARSLARPNHRNGYRERGWDIRAGRIDLAIPKLRKGSYFPSFLEPRRTAEKALAAVIQKACVHVPTRSVDNLVKAMGASGVSKSQVSCLVADALREASNRLHYSPKPISTPMMNNAGWGICRETLPRLEGALSAAARPSSRISSPQMISCGSTRRSWLKDCPAPACG